MQFIYNIILVKYTRPQKCCYHSAPMMYMCECVSGAKWMCLFLLDACSSTCIFNKQHTSNFNRICTIYCISISCKQQEIMKYICLYICMWFWQWNIIFIMKWASICGWMRVSICFWMQCHRLHHHSIQCGMKWKKKRSSNNINKHVIIIIMLVIVIYTWVTHEWHVS